MENKSHIHEAIKSEQSRYERDIAPEQKEKLDNLQVYKDIDLLTPELFNAIGESLDKEPTYSSEAARNISEAISEEKATVREVITKRQNGSEHHSLVKLTNPTEGLDVVEVFDLDDPETSNTVKSLKYEKYAVIDSETGVTANLLDLQKNDTDTYFTWRDTRTERNKKSGDILIDKKDVGDFKKIGATKDSIIPHEAGHSYQSDSRQTEGGNILGKFTKLFKSENNNEISAARHTVAERNAWAFALNAARKYREKGVDVTKLANYQDAERSLVTYQIKSAVPEKGINYSHRPEIQEFAKRARDNS